MLIFWNIFDTLEYCWYSEILLIFWFWSCLLRNCYFHNEKRRGGGVMIFWYCGFDIDNENVPLLIGEFFRLLYLTKSYVSDQRVVLANAKWSAVNIIEAFDNQVWFLWHLFCCCCSRKRGGGGVIFWYRNIWRLPIFRFSYCVICNYHLHEQEEEEEEEE